MGLFEGRKNQDQGPALDRFRLAMRGRHDLGWQAMTYGTMKALAFDNPSRASQYNSDAAGLDVPSEEKVVVDGLLRELGVTGGA